MDIAFPSVSILFATFLFLFILFRTLKKSRASRKQPPGPWKLPLIGNMHQLIGSLPHQILRDLAKNYGPLMHLQLGQVSTVVVSSPEIAEKFMKTHDIVFSDRPFILATKILSYNSTNFAFSPYGVYWRQLRKICNLELLSVKRVRSLRPIREEEVSNLIGSISENEGSEINFSKRIFSSVYGFTARAAFGMKNRYKEEFISTINKFMELAGGFNIADMYPSFELLHVISGMRPRLEKLHTKIDQILGDIIDEHKENKPKETESEEDLVDVLLRVQKNGDLEVPLTTNNIKAVILDIFIGGTDTTSRALVWAMSEMLKNPEIMKRAQQEARRVFDEMKTVSEEGLPRLKYLQAVIKETLRLHPSAPLLLPRECRETCEIDGYKIPAKTKVIVNGWAIGRDPRHWTDAEKFYPERFLDSEIDYRGTHFQYIPFGAGRRMCPGISFAVANIELPLAKLLYHFDWKLPGGMKEEELDMSEHFGVTVGRKNDLRLIPIAHRPSSAE